MASKSIQAKKKELLESIEARRSSINDRATHMQGSLKQISTKAKTDQLRNITPQSEGGASFSVMEKFKKLSSQAAAFSSKKHKVKGSDSLFLPAKTTSLRPADLPIKPILIGLSSLLILGALLGGSKKKKSKSKQKKLLAQEKEHTQVAKFGFGVLVLKWLLSASQPAVKHMITKKVKKGILG